MISNKIEISDQKRKLVMSIEHDRIWVDPTVDVNESARIVIDVLQKYIVNMVDTAVKKEREACAEVCELMYDHGWLDAKRCAKEIRARGQG